MANPVNNKSWFEGALGGLMMSEDWMANVAGKKLDNQNQFLANEHQKLQNTNQQLQNELDKIKVLEKSLDWDLNRKYKPNERRIEHGMLEDQGHVSRGSRDATIAKAKAEADRTAAMADTYRAQARGMEGAEGRAQDLHDIHKRTKAVQMRVAEGTEAEQIRAADLKNQLTQGNIRDLKSQATARLNKHQVDLGNLEVAKNRVAALEKEIQIKQQQANTDENYKKEVVRLTGELNQAKQSYMKAQEAAAFSDARYKEAQAFETQIEAYTARATSLGQVGGIPKDAKTHQINDLRGYSDEYKFTQELFTSVRSKIEDRMMSRWGTKDELPADSEAADHLKAKISGLVHTYSQIVRPGSGVPPLPAGQLREILTQIVVDAYSNEEGKVHPGQWEASPQHKQFWTEAKVAMIRAEGQYGRGTALKIMGDTMAEAKSRGMHVPPEWKLRMIMAHPGMDAASVAAVSGTADDIMRTRSYSEEPREE